jgi:integrase
LIIQCLQEDVPKWTQPPSPIRFGVIDRIRDSVGSPDTFVFHDFRHTQASLLLHSGADMKVIQARLGHARHETTANLYAHLLQGAQAEATSKLDSMMERKEAWKSQWAHFVGTRQKQRKPVLPF